MTILHLIKSQDFYQRPMLDYLLLDQFNGKVYISHFFTGC